MTALLKALAAALVLCHYALSSPAEQAKAVVEARRSDIDSDTSEVLPSRISMRAMSGGRFTGSLGFLYKAKLTAGGISSLTSLRIHGVSSAPVLTLTSPNTQDERSPVALKIEFEIPKSFVLLLIEIVNPGLLPHDKGYKRTGHATQDLAVNGKLVMKGLVSGACLKISTLDDVTIAESDLQWGHDFRMKVGKEDQSGWGPYLLKSGLFSDLQLHDILRKHIFGSVRDALTGKSYCKEE